VSAPDPAKRPKRWRGWLIDALVLVLIVGAVQWWQTRNMLEGPAPALPLETAPLLFPEHLLPAEPGQPQLVFFWADWCPVCRLELGTLESLSRDYRVITVASQSGDAQQLAAFMAGEGISFPVLVDPDGVLFQAWRAPGFPAAFVLDGQQRIRFRLMGYSSSWGIRLRLWLAGAGW
jgi:thiol-disulfide isomerase/thioredoxin